MNSIAKPEATGGSAARAAPDTRPFRLAVGIATVGRAPVLAAMLQRLRRQTRQPEAILVCAPAPEDVAGIAEAFGEVTLLHAPRGLTRQRNVILDQARDFDAVVYFDDDFVPCPHYLENTEALLRTHPDIVVATGQVLRDGILGPGLSFDEADAALCHCPAPSPDTGELSEVYNGYGCNMSIRLEPVIERGLAFDARLPLYAWLEDVDFGRQLAPHGRIVRSSACCGVHLGIKSGRQSGVRLGYSQIANPLYLVRKGSLNRRHALYLMSRNIAANIGKSLRPEPWVDRRGRLRGNLRAIADLARGRLDPARAASL